MVYRIADNVLSPLGFTTAANYQALMEGRSSLRRHASFSGRRDDDYVASQFTAAQRSQLMVEGLTWFESLAYRSIITALSDSGVDVTTSRTLLILSTTKGNIDHLSSAGPDTLLPAQSAWRIAALLGVSTQPVVVCNACVSGVSAIVTAQRLLETRCYDTAIVAGCDVVSHFVVSGFQSLKALSAAPCRPFDIERAGLNLGEAAATLILANDSCIQVHDSGQNQATTLRDSRWQIVSGALRNDACHISSPSPQGEACCSAIRYVTQGIDLQTLGAVNAHGTATLYNDQMESVALWQAGLSAVPLVALKGYFGHTLGASGLLETILTMHSADQGQLPATHGYYTSGVSCRVNIAACPQPVGHPSFVKIISGFGGVSAALYCRRGSAASRPPRPVDCQVAHSVRITPLSATVDGRPLPLSSRGNQLLADIYHHYVGTYPRYHKMDCLSQLGFLASELLSAQEQPRQDHCSHRAVVLFNHTSSLSTDREYARTIVPGVDYYPSPSLYVYTLPNIVCGEIALRHGYHGETSFYMMGFRDEEMMRDIVRSAFCDTTLQSILTGWVDYSDATTFEAEVKLINRKE